MVRQSHSLHHAGRRRYRPLVLVERLCSPATRSISRMAHTRRRRSNTSAGAQRLANLSQPSETSTSYLRCHVLQFAGPVKVHWSSWRRSLPAMAGAQRRMHAVALTGVPRALSTATCSHSIAARSSFTSSAYRRGDYPAPISTCAMRRGDRPASDLHRDPHPRSSGLGAMLARWGIDRRSARPHSTGGVITCKKALRLLPASPSRRMISSCSSTIMAGVVLVDRLRGTHNFATLGIDMRNVIYDRLYHLWDAALAHPGGTLIGSSSRPGDLIAHMIDVTTRLLDPSLSSSAQMQAGAGVLPARLSRHYPHILLQRA